MSRRYVRKEMKTAARNAVIMSIRRSSSAAFSLRVAFFSVAMASPPPLCHRSLLLQLDLQSFRRDLQRRALGLAGQDNLNLLGVDQSGRALAFLDRDTGSGGAVDAVEVVETLEVVDVPGGFALGHAKLADRQTVDLELVGLALVGQRAVAPAPADPGGDGSLGELDGGVGRFLVGRGADGGEAETQSDGQGDDRTTVHSFLLVVCFDSFSC